MSGPSPWYHPLFPTAFVEQAQGLVRQRTVAYQLRQRAELVLLLEADPLLANSRAAAEVHLHPNAVRYWRRRWAGGEFCLTDRGTEYGGSPDSHEYELYLAVEN